MRICGRVLYDQREAQSLDCAIAARNVVRFTPLKPWWLPRLEPGSPLPELVRRPADRSFALLFVSRCKFTVDSYSDSPISYNYGSV